MATIDDDFAAVESLEDELFGDSITYSRGTNSVTITAIAAEINREVEDEDGVPVQLQRRTYEINAADLVVGGNAITPRPGDLIAESINGTTQTFEVLPLGSKPCFDWLDSQHRRVLVYAKRIS